MKDKIVKRKIRDVNNLEVEDRIRCIESQMSEVGYELNDISMSVSDCYYSCDLYFSRDSTCRKTRSKAFVKFSRVEPYCVKSFLARADRIMSLIGMTKYDQDIVDHSGGAVSGVLKYAREGAEPEEKNDLSKSQIRTCMLLAVIISSGIFLVSSVFFGIFSYTKSGEDKKKQFIYERYDALMNEHCATTNCLENSR